MTLAIEPMITAGRYDVVWEDDGWTVATEDGSLASHYAVSYTHLDVYKRQAYKGQIPGVKKASW